MLAPGSGQGFCDQFVRSESTLPGTIIHLDAHRTLRIDWQGALDWDAYTDFLGTIQESCNAYGECEKMAFLGCSETSFTSVYGPEYAVALKPGERHGGNLLLIKTERSGNAAEFELRTRVVRLLPSGYFEDHETTLVEKSHAPN